MPLMPETAWTVTRQEHEAAGTIEVRTTLEVAHRAYLSQGEFPSRLDGRIADLLPDLAAHSKEMIESHVLAALSPLTVEDCAALVRALPTAVAHNGMGVEQAQSIIRRLDKLAGALQAAESQPGG